MIDSFYSQTEAYKDELITTNDSMAFYLSRGLSEYLTDKLDASVESLYKAELLAIRHNNKKYEAIVHNHIGNAFYLLKDNAKALDYYERVVDNDSAGKSTKAAIFNNIAVVAHESYKYSASKRTQDSLANIINYYYHKSIAFSKKNGEFSSLAGTYSVMIPWFEERGIYDSAFYYIALCRKLSYKHHLVGRIAFLRIKEGALLQSIGQHQAAIDTAQKAVDFYREQNNPDQLIHALSLQANAYDSLGDYKKSKMVMQQMYRLMKESFTKKRADAVGESEARFNTQAKELANQRLLAENKTKELKYNRLLLGSLVIVLALLGGLLLYRNKLRKKQLEMTQKEVEFKNKLIDANMEIEENERKRIARELHDGLGQQITTLKLGLENLASAQSKQSNDLIELKDMSMDILNNVRSISHQMIPLALGRFGLVSALESMVEKMNSTSKTSYTFETFKTDGIELDEEQQTHLYRIAQELVQNIEKHAKANHASLQLYTQNEQLFLVVSDEGIGLQKKPDSGIGLSNIQNRVQILKGKFAILSSQPFEVQISVPLV
jgi:signal transduction histidine kinase